MVAEMEPGRYQVLDRKFSDIQGAYEDDRDIPLLLQGKADNVKIRVTANFLLADTERGGLKGSVLFAGERYSARCFRVDDGAALDISERK